GDRRPRGDPPAARSGALGAHARAGARKLRLLARALLGRHWLLVRTQRGLLRSQRARRVHRRWTQRPRRPAGTAAEDAGARGPLAYASEGDLPRGPTDQRATQGDRRAGLR